MLIASLGKFLLEIIPPNRRGLLSLGQGNNNMTREGKQEGIDGGESSQDRLTLMLGLIVDLR